MTLNEILKDPNYQGLPEAERRKVWHKLFDRQYGSDPNFLGLPEAEQSRARDMYADRVMGSQRTQVQTAAPAPGYMRKEDQLMAEQSIAKIKEQNEKNLGVSLNPRLIDDTLSNISLAPNGDDNVFARVRRDIKFTEPAVADATQRGQQEVQSELDKIKRNAETRKRTFTLETEYQDNDARLRELSIKRGEDRAKSGEYQKLLQRQAEIEISYPRIAMGMNEDQYKAFELGRRFVKEHPALSYIDAFAVGLVNLSLGAGKMLMPGARGFDYLTYYEQGVASEGGTVGNLVRGTVSSLPTNIAMMANPTLAIPLTFADITSREVKEYYDEGALDAQAYFASAVSGVVQTAIEYMSDTKQLDIAKDALRKHGAQAAQDSITKSVRQRFFPTMDTLRRTLHAGAMYEAAEEVFQGVASVAINHVINGKPLPDADEFARELALSAVGGYLGGFLMGGGATGVQIYQHNEVAKYIQHNANTYESIQMLQQSIDLINNAKTFEDIDMASDLLRDAKAKAVKEGVEHPRLLQGFNLASGAIMANRANQVQAIKSANQELGKEITDLKQQADTIRREGFEPGFETEQGAKLYDLEDQIKVKEREYKKGLQEIHSNKELEMMGEALDRMDIEMAQLHAESAGMPYDAEYDPSADQGKEIKSPVMMEGRRRETMPEKNAAPIESKQEDSTSSSEPVPIDSNTVPSQTERAMPAEPANTENDKITSIKLDSETKQSKSLTIGKINEDVDRADPKESKRIPEEALGRDKTVVKGRGKGTKHKIRHALIPLKDILVSHDADFNENKDYPQELQPRDRSKGASRAKNNQVTAELDPYRLMDNYLASEGRPIVVVDKDGRIIALTGNGRLIALKRRAAGEYDGIQEYEQTLREHLEDFGFNDQDTAGKVLVGVYYGDADLIQLANAMNESEGDAMSPVEQAAADAKQIANLKKHGDDIMEALDVNTEDVMSAANTGFLRLFAERLGLDITKYQTSEGKWNNDFRTRVENALFMYIFNNNESAKRALSAWRETDTSNMKSVLTGVMNAIKLIAKYRNAVEKYKTVDLDITVDLLEAIDVITRLRKEGKTLEQEANEMDLFSDGNEAIPSDKLSLYQAIAMIKTIKRGTEFIKGYYSEAMDLADPNQMSFLYDPNTSKEDFLNQYTEGFIKRNEKKKDDRSPAQRSATETPAKTHGEDREGSGRSDRSEEDVVSGRRLRTGANESRLNSIPDSVAEDALLGLFKSHIAKTERDGRKLAITFKDGRKLTLDRLNKNFKITMPDGRKLDMYGRTYSKTIDGTFNVFMDLVDGLNGGNRTLYHEAFHVAWKLFMTTEQIDMISRYYAKRLGPEASIVDIEEAAANAAQNWLGNRAEVPPGFRNIFRRFWDRVRHALVSLGLANENQKIEDIFWGLEQDRLQGKGTEDKGNRNRAENDKLTLGEGVTKDGVRYRLDEAYHGTGALFNRFDVEYIGTGEGAQAFGWGIYVTENEGVARDYARRIGGAKLHGKVTIGNWPVVIEAKTFDNDVTRLASLVVDDYLKSHEVSPENKDAAIGGIKRYIASLANALIGEKSTNDKIIAQGLFNHEIGIIDTSIEYVENKSFHKAMKSELINFYESYMQHQDISHEPFTEGNKVLYTLSVWENHQEDVLDWRGSPTEEQKTKIISALIEMRDNPSDGAWSQRWIDKLNDKIEGIKNDALKTGGELYTHISDFLFHGNPKAASQFLLRAGIDGIKYPVNALRGGTGNKGYNYVVFDDSQIKILETTRYRAEQAEIAEAERQMAEVRAKYEGKEWHKSLPTWETITRMNNVIDTPYDQKIKEGALFRDPNGDDPYIYETRYVNPKDYIDKVHLEGETYDKVVSMPTTQKYIEWYKQGYEPPPMTLVVHYKNGLSPTERRRWVAAIEAGVKKVPALVEIGRASEMPNHPGYLKAPNGKKTNLNERQWLQVRTQLFKDWFGDWENDPANASKVVDENGEPMVVYHGSHSDKPFHVFGEDKASSQGSYLHDSQKAYFFADYKTAKNYEYTPKDPTREPMAVFLCVKNPMSIDVNHEVQELLYDFDGDISEAEQYGYPITRWMGDAVESFEDNHSAVAYFDDNAQEIYGDAKERQHDGISIDGVDGTFMHITFSPTQIKSATANVGTFDPQNPDIRYRIEDTEAERQMAEVRAKYEGTDQWMKAPNGEPTMLNERQWLQVRTQLFKDWFGDWENDPKNASKVVDENGEPMVVYHGTNINTEIFTEFEGEQVWHTKTESVTRFYSGSGQVLRSSFRRGEKHPVVKMYGIKKQIENGDYSSLNENRDDVSVYDWDLDNWIKPEDDDIEEVMVAKYKNNTPVKDIAFTYDNFLRMVNPLEVDNDFRAWDNIIYSGNTYDTRSISDYAKNSGHDGVIINNILDPIEADDQYITFSPTQIKSATANVGTFDKDNPDIRYRVEDTDLDARLKRAHEMLKKYSANADPKEASKKIATEIAKAKNLDPSQADEKIGRMIRAAYREGEGKAKESLAAFGIAETEAFIQTNKPDGTDKQDLTFHMEEALEYAADMGLSEADVKNLGADRFTYYLQGLNMYGYGNALTQQLNEKYAEKQALAAKGITDEALDAEISDLISLVADARLKYENMKGAAGRLLQHARWEKSNRIKDLIKIAEVITETRDAQIAEINAIEAEMAELNTMLTELEKEFELLLDDIERLSGSRFKSDSIEELRERKRLMAEQRAEMKNRMEVLKHRLTKAREGLQTSEKQNRAIREQLDKAGKIEFTEEEQNVLKQIVESGVLNEEQLEAIGTTMKTGFRPTATGLKAIAPLTGSTSDLTPKQAELIKKILDHGKKPATVTEFPLMDADWIDVVSNAFYQIILSSPITHARNIIGNEANLALENLVNTVLHRDLRPVINSILSAKEGVRNTKEAWKHAEAYMKKYNLDTNSRIMKKFTMITRALAAEDAFYYSRNYAAQMTGIAIAEAKRTGKSTDYILRNPTLAMIKQAEYEASRGTWNYDPEGILGYITKAIETGVGMAQHGGKLGKISALMFKMNVMPFTRVVANVLSTALDWSPVGYLGAVKYATGIVDKEFKLGKGVTIRQRKVWTDEKGNAIKSPFAKRDTTRQLARATMGTIMLSLAYMLLEGIISGSGEDDWEKRKQLMETGWRPNSIKIAGRWHSYMMLPIAPLLSAIANFQERRRKPGARAEEVLAATVMGMANTILDQSFLSNLAQLMEAITGNNHRYLIRAAADTPTRVIPISPNLLRVIADAVNDKAYAPETFIQYLMYSGRPWTNGWIKDNIPAMIDVFGREAKKTSSFRDFPGSPVMDGQPLYVYDKNDIPHDMRSILNTILGAGLKIPSTNAYEARVGDDQFIKLKGFDKEQFLRQRGFYLSMGLLSYQADIEYLAKEGEIDELDNLLRKIASRSTRDAKREMIYRYIDGEMRHKYSVYSKSKDRRNDEED